MSFINKSSQYSELDSGILQYLYRNLNYRNNHKQKLLLTDSSKLLLDHNNYIYVSINVTSYELVFDLLNHYQLNLSNGAIIHLINWYTGILDKGVYQAFIDWKNTLNYSKFVEFPVKNSDEKAFIYLKLDNYNEWSE